MRHKKILMVEFLRLSQSNPFQTRLFAASSQRSSTFEFISSRCDLIVCEVSLRMGGDSAPPLLVVGPAPLRRFLDAYNQVEPLSMEFVDCRAVLDHEWEDAAAAAGRGADEDLSGGSAAESGGGNFGGGGKWSGDRRGQWGDDLSKVKEVCRSLGLLRLSATRVVHCAQSFALVLESELKAEGVEDSSWKLVYSGDTRPCPALTAASRRGRCQLKPVIEKRKKKMKSSIKTVIESTNSSKQPVIIEASDQLVKPLNGSASV